jgi:hypothetical protein
LILFSHLRLNLPNGLFRSNFPSKIFYAPLISAMRNPTICPYST